MTTSTPPLSLARPRPWRPTLGLLTYGPGDPNSYAVWAGVASQARERDVNLICFPGRPLRSPLGFEARANVLYDLLSADRLDGLIIWVAGLTRWVEAEEFRAFCQRYEPLPMVTVGGLVKGLPGVIVDNYHGMRDVVAHLALAHHRRRIAFIRGPERHQEAEERYRAYCDVLAEAGLPFDPNLVVVGDFYETGGAAALETLLNQRQAHFDALAAASDDMAIGAMKALQARGIRIPDDIAIAGLNDNSQSRVIMPPLTTGPLHFYEQARQATEMVLALMDGREVPERVVLPTRLLIRQSCGCPDPLIVQAAAEPGAVNRESLASAVSARRPLILAELFQAADSGATDLGAGWAHQLLDAFMADITQVTTGAFLSALAEVLRQSAAVEDPVSKWHGVISVLRRHLRPLLAQTDSQLLHAENLWQQARVLIGETAQRVQAYQAVQAERQVQALGEISQMLSATIDGLELPEILRQTLPRLDIAAFCLSLYENPEAPAEWSRLIVASDGQSNVEASANQGRFPSRRLAPDSLLRSQDQCHSFVVEPLYFRENQLGFVLFEADPRQEEVYEILRGEISGALKRTLLAAHNIELYHEAVQARQVAEDGRRLAEEGRRLAEEADRLKSRFLATVSHELRTPLSLIVGTMEMMLRDETTVLPESYRSDLSSVGASAQHLARLIGDVLDLASNQAGELRLACEALNLGEVLQEAKLLGEPIVREKGLVWKAHLPQPLPLVWGDRTRLRQVVLNLISNTVKFTQHGEVELGVETDGQTTVTVSVRDTGIGIPVEEQALIFDEFRQSDRTARRGYGGMGLGLAISRRLIELHGGQIGVHSSGQEGAGSTFYFTLPVLAPPAGQAQAAGATQTVVLLTQHAGGARRLQVHLAQRGFAVEERAIDDQPDWLDRIVASPPGAVVLDWQPAEDRGWELMQLLKQNPATQDMPVVFYSLSGASDRGSILELDLLAKPLASTELAQALERQGLTGECQTRRTILLADDDPGILDLHARIVQSHLPDCQVLRAHNGREALELLARTRPDLVLLDLMMPEVDGFQVLETMRSLDTARDVPVIIMTARILSYADMVRLQQGVAAVLGKGLFSGPEVLAQVEATLARSKRLGSESQRIVRQVMAFIHEHYAEAVTLDELTRCVCLSERHLNRCFQHEVGMTAMTYLNRYRVRQAKFLLEQGKPILQVALAVGYTNSNYFGRVFRQEVGVSPRAYQQGQRPAPTIPAEPE